MLQTLPINVKGGYHIWNKTKNMHIIKNWRKKQVGWAFVIGQKTQKCVKTNNVLHKRSPHHVLDFVEMTMRSLCWKVCEKYNGDGHT
jgi:hypothetical protein